MNYSSINKLFEDLAFSHRAISHSEKTKAFVNGDMGEILATIRGLPASTTFMVLHNDEFSFNDVKSSNIELRPSVGVSIAIKPAKTKTTYAEEQELLQETFQIMYQVCRRLHEYWYSGQQQGIRFLDLNEVKVNRIWKKNFEGCLGWMAEIPMNLKADPYNPDEIWQ